MNHPFRLFRWLLSLPAALGLGTLAQAQFTLNSADIPQGGPVNNSSSENIDFGDVDQDGDWDAVFANGGDNGLEQNRIWINRGPGPNLGKFQDQTAARFPAINDVSRDIEFVDFDGDSDLDLYIANTSSIVAATDRWWHNTGGGHYVDETATRWVGLGGTGSSVHPGHVLASGGFIDFVADGDFGDLDNDGDMDLFHSSYGGAFGGQTPSRVFLNDGAGNFEEFNPVGFQMTNGFSDGDPGIWCEGVQSHSTLVSDGSECDIATSATDIDLGDIDGDFDLDVLHGSRNLEPRMFQNRTVENGGGLGFRDVTGATFPPGYVTGSGHYEQEMGDMDGDGDLDILGVNWQQSFNFHDGIFRNRGDGVYEDQPNLPNSGADDSEGDFIDYDNDGDLDVVIANWSGQDRLYRNTTAGATITFVEESLPASSSMSLDGECCDVDGDGDYDIFVSANNYQPNIYYENTTQVPDGHAPYMPRIEQAPSRTPGPSPTVVRAQVYDNAPYYITWYNETNLVYTVDGANPVTVPARSSGGQIFRAEIPGNLLGLIEYHFTSEDEYGNVGTSPTRAYASLNGGFNLGNPFCFGDGTGAACPCGFGPPGAGCLNSAGGGATLTAFGHGSFATDSFGFSVSGAPGNTPGLVLRGTNSVANTIGEGILCTTTGIKRSQVVVTSVSGTANFTDFKGSPFGTVALVNAPTNFQFYYRDVAGACVGAGFNFSNAWSVTYVP